MDGEEYQESLMMAEASNLLLHQINQLSDMIPSLTTELTEEINVILHDIEEQLIQLVQKLVDLFKDALQIKIVHTQLVSEGNSIKSGYSRVKGM